MNIVEDIESWASIDRQNSLNDLLDEQDETPVPALFVPPPPSPPSRPSPPPNHLVEDCVNPIYRLHHSNDTCLDWKKTCINGHFVIKNGAVCNGFSEDPASGPGVYVDAKCSLHHQDLKRCLPWNTRHQHERCRKRNYFGPKRQAVCKEWMKNDSDLFHNSLSPFWVDPQCGSLQVRLEQVDRREHDHFEGGERCRTWHWLEAAKKCRVRTGMYEMPHYKRSPFCVAACLRDPLCPGDAKHEARARIAGLCPTLYAQNELFSQRLPEVCEPLKYGVNGGDVMIKGAFYST